MEAIPQTFMQEPIFRKLDQVAQYGALNETDKIAYNQSLKAYRDAYAIYKTERNAGRAEGIAEGRADERIAIAENLIKMNNLNDEMIAQATNLKPEEIMAIRLRITN